ncbi:MAG: PQQ-like beta-propeller repeat protein [Bacteroidales bacterium]|nr:PQQ-like beta-propeller repeat protein [Bacteroidales bacterium]
MSDPVSSVGPPAVRRGFPRRGKVPILALVIPALLKLTLLVIHKWEWIPEAIFPLTMLFQLTLLLAIVVCVTWFFGFSGAVSWAKVSVLVLVVGLGVAAYMAVHSIEFDGQMNPKVYFVWDPDPEQQLVDHLQSAGAGIGGADLQIGPTDSPVYRGPTGDGVAAWVALADTWDTPPQTLWRHPVGGGHAGVAVAGNSAITIEQRGEQEAIVCYDRATGVERWVVAYTARFRQAEPVGGDGPRSTPTIAAGQVFTLGATGELLCIDGATGTRRWQINILQDNGAKNLEWGLSTSPLVIEGKVIVNCGVDPANNTNQALAAYDCATGKKLWAHGSHPAGYASPRRATLEGVEQVVVFDGGGLGGYDPSTGAELWRHPWRSDMGMNSAQPLLLGGNRVFVSSEKSNGCAVVEVQRAADGRWTTREVWKSRALATRFCNPVLYQEHVYGLTDGCLICVDVSNGRRLWREGDFGNGQMVRSGDKLVLTTESGEIALVAPNPMGLDELARMKLFSHRTWNVPTLAGKQFFVRNHHEMAVLELP